MSLFELLLIVFVAVLLIKPDDIPVLSKNIAKIYSIFKEQKDRMLSHIFVEIAEEDKNIEANKDQINYFLDRIAYLGDNYSGDYDLEKIKSHYKKLIEQEIIKLGEK